MDKVLPPDIYNIDVTIYQELEQVSNTLSKSRVRIFYKGMNRNRTYISEEVEKQIIKSIPYAPIKGIFDKEDLDFTDHGEKRTDGKIYGIVPENPHIAYEEHLDDDGIMRTYICADVLLFTGLYPEAKLIVGKPQSMELNPTTLDGEYRTGEDGKPYFHFLSAELLGLSVLGEDVEPCFEGAAFYNLKTEIKTIYDYIKSYEKQEEKKRMNKYIFELSHGQTCAALISELAKVLSEFYVIDVYDDYCIVANCETGEFFRYSYSEDEDTVTLGENEKVFSVYVTETEKKALDAMSAIGSYSEIEGKITSQEEEIAEFKATEESLRNSIVELNSKIESYEKDNSTNTDDSSTDTDDNSVNVEEYTAQIEKLESEKVELNATIDTYKKEIEEKESEIVRLNSSIDDITCEKSELEQFKLNIEKEKKEEILAEFASSLTEEDSANFSAKMDEYSVEDFKKEVCFAAYNSNPTMFTHKETNKDSDLIYKNADKNTETGALKLLNKYKGGNK